MSDREKRAKDLAAANAHRQWEDMPPTERDVFRRQAEREGHSSEVSDGSSDQTNATAYVGTAMRGRLEDLRDLLTLSTGDAEYDVSDERADALGIDHGDYVGDQALTLLFEYPLCVEAMTTFEIVLGTGGPDDRLLIECEKTECQCAGDHCGGHRFVDTEPEIGYEIRRILYRYSWEGSGERVLHGDDLATAEAFARRVVPELSE